MYRIWEHPDTKVPDRPPVCVIACSWYPEIRLKALACPDDVSVDGFLCGLQLPDALYRVLTGNRPTKVYIGNECRILDGLGEHKTKPLRHVAIALRLVTEKGKCTLLFPDQYLRIREDTLVELACCETITSTQREVRIRLVEDRPLLDDEEKRFLATQHANSQWLWTSSLAPLPRRPLSEDSERPLPPWKPPRTLEWVKHVRLRQRKQQPQPPQFAELGQVAAADDSMEPLKISDEIHTEKYRQVSKRDWALEGNTPERPKAPTRIDRHVFAVGGIEQSLDERQTEHASCEIEELIHDPEKHLHKRPRIESTPNKLKTPEDKSILHDEASQNGHSPLRKAVSELGNIINSLTKASPGDIKSPLREAITNLGHNIDMLKNSSNMDKRSQRDAISQLGDHIQHLKALSDDIVEQTADFPGTEKDNSIMKNLFHRHDTSVLPMNSTDIAPDTMVAKSQAVADLPALDSDAQSHQKQNPGIANGGTVPLLPLRPPASPEPELEKVWSDVEDDKNAAVLEDFVETNSIDEPSASSSASTTSDSSSSSSSSSNSPDSASESDSDSAEELGDGEVNNIEKVSNEDAAEGMEFNIAAQPVKNNEIHSPPGNGELDEKESAPALPLANVKKSKDPTTPKAQTSEAAASNNSNEDSSSDSSSQSSSESDSDTSSDSQSAITPSQSKVPVIVVAGGDAKANAIPKNVRESLSVQGIGKAETGKDHKTPPQIGVNPTPPQRSQRRRKPLLSSKKKIII